jgi:hypothetical protein
MKCALLLQVASGITAAVPAPEYLQPGEGGAQAWGKVGSCPMQGCGSTGV